MRFQILTFKPPRSGAVGRVFAFFVPALALAVAYVLLALAVDWSAGQDRER